MTVREMYEEIGYSVQRVRLHLVGKDGDTSENKSTDGVWATTGTPKCHRCDEPFDDGEEIVLGVEVEESTFSPGKPGCSQKFLYHEECASPEMIHEIERA